MSKSNYLENAILDLLFNGTAITDLAENATTTPATNLYVALHTADPGEDGTQSTSEVAYTSYARVAVARSSGGWTVTGNSVSPTATISFPACTGGSATATHFSIGMESSGASAILYKGALNHNISIAETVTPQLTTTTTITED
jgi:hypothetical protein